MHTYENDRELFHCRTKILPMTANDSNTILEDRIDQFQPDAENLSVRLNHQNLTDQDMEIVVKNAIQKRQCTLLHLQDNKITAEGMTVLAPALKDNAKLRALYLHGNHFSDKGIYELIQVLMSNNNTLEILGLNSTGLTDVGAEDLSAMLQQNKALKRLQLEGNQIDTRGMLHLCEALTNDNTTLEQLEMADNKLVTDSSVDYLVKMIQTNRSLKVLDMRNCNISDAGKGKLQQAMESNKDLQLILENANPEIDPENNIA